MRTIASILALSVALTALPGCGGGEEPDPAQQASAPAAPILGGQRAPSTSGDSTATPPTTGSTPAASVAFDDSSAEAAVATYVNRYMAGDFAGALEVCDPSSDGAAQLAKTIEGMEKAKAEGLQVDLAMLLVQGLEGVHWEKVEATATDERVEFLLKAPDRQHDKTCVAVLLEGVWRVQPDPSGNP